MRNPDLPKLLRAISNSLDAQLMKHDIIFEQAAIELEKLEKIYKLNDDADSPVMLADGLLEILNEAP